MCSIRCAPVYRTFDVSVLWIESLSAIEEKAREEGLSQEEIDKPLEPAMQMILEQVVTRIRTTKTFAKNGLDEEASEKEKGPKSE